MNGVPPQKQQSLLASLAGTSPAWQICASSKETKRATALSSRLMESTASQLESTHLFQQLLPTIGTVWVSVTRSKATLRFHSWRMALLIHAGTIRATQSLVISSQRALVLPVIVVNTTASPEMYSTIGNGEMLARTRLNQMLSNSSSLTKTTERAGQLETPLTPSHSTGMPRSTKTTPDLFSQAQQLWQPEELHFSQQS